MRPLDAAECRERMGGLYGEWLLDEAAGTLTRSFVFKGYARPVQLVGNLAQIWQGRSVPSSPLRPAPG